MHIKLIDNLRNIEFDIEMDQGDYENTLAKG